MSYIDDVLASIGAQTMGDSVQAPFANFDIAIPRLAEAICGISTVDLSAGGAADYLATAAQIRGATVVLSGATAARNFVVENLPFKKFFENPSAFPITVKCSATTGVVVPAGGSKELKCDGTTVKDISVDISQSSNVDVEINVTGAADTITLDTEQSLTDFLYVDGTLSQDTTIEVEFTTTRSFFVSRATTGAFTLRIKKSGAAGAGQAINAGEFVAVRMVP